jgi:hypothetical protein
MSRDEQLSTRDLASTPTEPRDQTDVADDRQDLQTSTRDDDMAEMPQSAPAAARPDESEQDRRDRDADVQPDAETAAVAPADRTEPAAESVAEPSTDQVEPDRDDGAQAQLLADDEGAELGRRWEAIQVKFVDDPRRAVEDADGLVAHVMQQLADGFARERETLEGQWSRGEDVSTEDLRVALQRYRSFFQRLLSA